MALQWLSCDCDFIGWALARQEEESSSCWALLSLRSWELPLLPSQLYFNWNICRLIFIKTRKEGKRNKRKGRGNKRGRMLKEKNGLKTWGWRWLAWGSQLWKVMKGICIHFLCCHMIACLLCVLRDRTCKGLLSRNFR